MPVVELGVRAEPRVLVSVLGPVRVRTDGADVGLGPRLERVLGALVARRGSVVDVHELIDMVWQEAPPASALGSLRTYVTRLRHLLDTTKSAITFRQSGYMLDTSEMFVDADLFERELDDAHLALRVADFEMTDRLLGWALGRWSGRPYTGFDDDHWVRAERARLQERHSEALEVWVEVMLADGRNEPAVALARSIAEDTPLRERPRELLMRALYLAGRQVEAIRVYRDFRERLAVETGLEPTIQFSELEGRIVRGELPRTASVGRARGYELLDRLGAGAFAVVHRAIQPVIGREVAVKVVRSELANLPTFVRSFEREAQLIASIEHPHVVPLYDFWREPGAAYLVMRLMRGGSLASVLCERGPLSRDEIVSVFESVGGALHAAHRGGVVHGDVRPANLLRDGEGATYLADFGISVSVRDVGQSRLHFVAPEVLRGEPAGPRSDVLSLGVTTFQMLTGRLPFGDSADRVELVRRLLEEPLPSARAIRTDLPAEIDDVLARATSKVRADRYESVPDFVDDAIAAIAERRRTHRHPVGDAPVVNPYLGLRSFTEADAGRFQGREQLVGMA